MKWFIKCLRQYADFDGRARRKEYWWFAVINFIISMILIIGWMVPFVKMGFDAAANGNEVDEVEIMLSMFNNPFMYIYLIYYMAMLIPGLAVMVRRLHDIGKSGFWGFFIYGGSILGSIASVFLEVNADAYGVLALVCLAICVISLVWMFTDSQYGPNKYGPNPKGEGNPPDETAVAVE